MLSFLELATEQELELENSHCYSNTRNSHCFSNTGSFMKEKYF